MSIQVDIIAGFPESRPDCRGCDETRWRLLMELQQKQSFELEQLSK